jgi:hypothetical protein
MHDTIEALVYWVCPILSYDKFLIMSVRKSVLGQI